jgi:uncharacterized protein YjbJ (UPF0337 family)
MADMENTFDKMKGDAKAGVGEATGNERLEAEGRTESTAAGVKGAAQDAGDKIKGAAEGVKNAFTKD